MNHLVIEKIRTSEIDEVATVLTEAFRTNPAYGMIFKRKDQVEAGLSWLFKASMWLLNYKQPLTNVIKERATGKIIGTFTLVPPAGVKNSFSAYMKIGIPGFISTFGISPFFRMLSLETMNKNVLRKSMTHSGFYYLSMFVIKKEYQGTGIGSYALKNLIGEFLISQPACRVIGLTTQLPENVTFYSKVGFITLDEGYIEYKGERYYNYNMKLDVSGLTPVDGNIPACSL